MNVSLSINGFDETIFYDDYEVEQTHLALLKKLTQLSLAKPNQRTIVYLVAPPGTGKSTLGAFWEYLSRQHNELKLIQTLPMDGFHFDNHYLKNTFINYHGEQRALYQIKGMPESFDLKQLTSYLQTIQQRQYWPFYDRRLHEPVIDAIQIEQSILIVEGNWLLLNEPGWKDLKQYADCSIFIDTKAEILKQRLITRKIKGGCTEQQAITHYNLSDKINVDRVLQQSLQADIMLQMAIDGSYHLSTTHCN